MKVYFTAAISQKHDFEVYYRRIVDALQTNGYEVESGNLFNMNVTSIYKASEEERLKWYNKSLEHINSADLVFVEISFPSTVNVGHELSVAVERGKPVVALYRMDRDPIFLRGKKEDKLFLFSYSDRDLEDVVVAAAEYATETQDTRFNFFISPKIGSYLDWVSKEKRIPRAVYLRRLIEQDMKKHQKTLED